MPIPTFDGEFLYLYIFDPLCLCIPTSNILSRNNVCHINDIDIFSCVRRDMEVALNKIVPASWTRDGTFHHTMEGDDDMPGHVKASLMGPSINIPVSGDATLSVEK